MNGDEDFDPAEFGIADVRNAKDGRDEQDGTAAMLTNQWALSAKHVIDRAGALGTSILLPELKINNERHRLDPFFVFEHPKYNVSLSRLPRGEAFTINNSRSGFTRALSALPNASAIVNAAAADGGAICFGFGPFTTTSAGAGVLRNGVFPIFESPADKDPHIFRTRDSQTTLLHEGGDSGGPCLQQAGGDLLGVHFQFERLIGVPITGGGTANAPSGYGTERLRSPPSDERRIKNLMLTNT